MDRSSRQRTWDRSPFLRGSTVGYHQIARPRSNRCARIVRESVESGSQSVRAFQNVEGCIENDRPAIYETRHLVWIENETGRTQGCDRTRFFAKESGLRTDEGRDRHDVPLAQVIDRRVGHLSEALLEVTEDDPRRARERRLSGVIAHRGGGLRRIRPHRPDDDGELFLRVPSRDLAGESVSGRIADGSSVAAHDLVFADPITVRTPSGETGFDGGIVDHAAVGRRHEKHLPRSEPGAS